MTAAADAQVIGPPFSHVVVDEIDDEVVLYDPTTKRFVHLNITASDVWRLADGEMTVTEIVEALASSYSTAAELIRGDVIGIIEELVDEGMLPAPT